MLLFNDQKSGSESGEINPNIIPSTEHGMTDAESLGALRSGVELKESVELKPEHGASVDQGTSEQLVEATAVAPQGEVKEIVSTPEHLNTEETPSKEEIAERLTNFINSHEDAESLGMTAEMTDLINHSQG